MPGTHPVDFLFGHCGSGLLSLNGKAVRLGRSDPRVHARRLRRREFGVGTQTIERRIILADDHPQGVALDLALVLGRDLLRARQVVTRLRFLRVGDRRRPDLEILFRLFELLRDRLLVGTHCAQVFLGVEDVEIRLRHAQNQILRRLGEIRLGLHHLQLGLPVLDDVLPAEERLGQADVVRMRVVVLADDVRAVAGFVLVFVPQRVGAGAERRQQPGQPLRQLFASGLGRRPGRHVLGVVGQRVAIDLDDVGGLQRRGEHGRQQQGRITKTGGHAHESDLGATRRRRPNAPGH